MIRCFLILTLAVMIKVAFDIHNHKVTYCWNQPMPAPDDIPKQCCRCKISGVPLMRSASGGLYCADCAGFLK